MTSMGPSAYDPSAPTGTDALSVMDPTPRTNARDPLTQGVLTEAGPTPPPPRPPGNSLPTPIKVRELARLLREVDHPGRDYIIEGFSKGFDLGFRGPESALDASNNLSVNQNPEAALEKVLSEVKLGRIAGPFPSPPLPNFKCSPLSLREKSTPGKYRLLHNLSYPYNESAVNFNIPPEASHLQYSDIRDAIEMINQFDLLFLAKADIKEAYRLVPLSPACYHLLGFKLKGSFYYDRCLPMGASSSCKIFETISSSLLHILFSLYKVKYVVKMLDDFLFLGKSERECQYGLDSFVHLCRLVGIPLANEKTVPPSRSVTFLGVCIDTQNKVISIPMDKVSGYLGKVSAVIEAGTCSLRELKSLIGKLQFSCLVIPAGRCFLRRLHDATMGNTNPHRRVTLPAESKKDLEIWRDFLSHFNGRGLLSYGPSLSSLDLHMHSDSSLTGYGATLGTRFIEGMFPPSWEGLDIQTLELYPVLALILSFSPYLAGKSIVMHVDNLGLVHMLNKQTSRSKSVMALLRPLVLCFLTNNIKFKAVHIRGSLNILCDLISRQQASPEVLRFYGMDETPTPLAPNILPESWSFS